MQYDNACKITSIAKTGVHVFIVFPYKHIELVIQTIYTKILNQQNNIAATSDV